MKILWISHLVPYPPKAGVLIRSFNLVRELGERHALDVLTLNQPRLMADYYRTQAEGIEAAKDALSEYVNNLWIEDIPAERSPLSRLWLIGSSFLSRDSYTIRWLKSKKMEQRLAAILAENTYDLIHIDTISLDYLRPLIPADIPLVLDHHNIESHMMERRASKEANPLKKVYLYWEFRKLKKYEETNIDNYDANIVCSSDDKSRLLELCRDAMVEVIPNGIQINAQLPERTPKENRLLFVGGLGWYPNAAAVRDFVEHIAPILRNSNVQFHFDIIGSNPPKDLVETCDDLDDIEFHGFVDNIEAFYQDAVAFVCPINDGGGTKLKVLDAMAQRVPLVGYVLACEGIEVTNGENVLIADSPQQFAEHVSNLISDPENAKRIGNNGRLLIENQYCYSIIGTQLDVFYRAISASADAG